jgi:hypothetical protein
MQVLRLEKTWPFNNYPQPPILPLQEVVRVILGPLLGKAILDLDELTRRLTIR